MLKQYITHKRKNNKPYYKKCSNSYDCKRCQNDRLYNVNKRKMSAIEQIKEYFNEHK